MSRPELRPSPEALLAGLRDSGRGQLKIFVGAAPGVGKTFEMLTHGLQRQAEGVDVVIAVVETHGREETCRLTESLESLPRRQIAYRGQQLEEFDVDALLERKPQVALVDELAHTNVPGSRHEKRWQDVEEVLSAGIDVYTTLNVQHLASLNDIIARISRITVRETVPDRILEDADQIELVDLSPDDLVQRLNDGKVYLPETAARVRQHFFSHGNLTALRELAMRAAAERVDADVLNWRRARAIDEPWPIQERLMVLIGDSLQSLRLVRLGKRLADRRGAVWVVANVSRPGSTTGRGDQAANALRLAEELGADTVLLSGQDLVTAILDCANERNVTQIIVGRSARPWRFLTLRRSLAGALLREAQAIDITIAAAADPVEAVKDPSPERRKLSFKGWRSYADALIVTAVCTTISWFLYPLLVNANLGLVLLTGVLIAATRGGVGPALFASVLSFLLFNFLFTEPRFTFKVTYEQDILTLVFFLLIAIVTGQLAARVRRQLDSIQDSNSRIALLEDFSRRLTGIAGQKDFASVLINYLGSTLRVRAIVLRKDYSSTLKIVAGVDDRNGLTDSEQAAAEWAYQHRENAGLGTGTLPGSHWLFLPITGRKGCLAMLGVRPLVDRQALDPEQKKLLVAMRDLAGIALDRLLLTAEMERNRLLVETDKLRSALLSSVSHDLRTPLVSIKGTASAMLELGEALDSNDQRELLQNVLDEAERLNRYVQNLLEMTRLGYGALKPDSDWCDIRDIAAVAVRDLKAFLGSRAVEVSVHDGAELIHTDNQLLGQVLVNLLENAAKYSPAESPIKLEARRGGDTYELSVSDLGPGIPADERERVFDMFHRVQVTDQRALGTGMGLAICKGLIEALGGTISAGASDTEKGTRITVRLPQPKGQPSVRRTEE
jgi:two-component system sensor histidine kinase KdpD